MTNKGKRIFKIIFLLFMIVVLIALYDLARHTTAPWKKKKAPPVEKPF
jgi:hypothetical protein